MIMGWVAVAVAQRKLDGKRWKSEEVRGGCEVVHGRGGGKVRVIRENVDFELWGIRKGLL